MTFVFELKLMVNKASEDSKDRQFFSDMSYSHDTAMPWSHWHTKKSITKTGIIQLNIVSFFFFKSYLNIPFLITQGSFVFY